MNLAAYTHIFSLTITISMTMFDYNRTIKSVFVVVNCDGVNETVTI